MKIKEEQARKIISKNINHLIRSNPGMSQKKLAEILDVSPAAISYFIHESQTPTIYPFLAGIHEHFNLSIDDFVFTDLSQKDNIIVHDVDSKNDSIRKTYLQYTGIYLLYYFSTSASKGKEAVDTSAALKYGIMCIYEQASLAGFSEYKVSALLGFSKDNAELAYRKAHEFTSHTQPEDYSEAVKYIHTFDDNQIYNGNFDLSSHAFLSLRSAGTDQAFMVFHRPPHIADKYIGGLGTVNSASKGRSSSPCIQYIGLSRYMITSSSEEIAAQLMLEYPAIKANSEVDSLVALAKQLYSTDSTILSPYPQLTEEEKYWMFKRNMETLISEMIERSLFRCKQISQDNDDKWYHFIKQFINQ